MFWIFIIFIKLKIQDKMKNIYIFDQTFLLFLNLAKFKIIRYNLRLTIILIFDFGGNKD